MFFSFPPLYSGKNGSKTALFFFETIAKIWSEAFDLENDVYLQLKKLC